MNSRRLYAVYGVSGCGRGVLPVARTMLARQQDPARYDLVFVDDSPPAEQVNGHRILTYEQFLRAAASEKFVIIAIANSEIRQRLAERCERDGVAPFTVVAENAVIMDAVTIGAGSILSPFVTVASNVTIGRHFHANLYAYVEHDCVIGHYVTFGPAAKCNGNISIEDHAYVGAGAVLRQGRPGAPLVIGARAVIGMGAVVTKSVPAGTTVAGNPARPLIKS